MYIGRAAKYKNQPDLRWGSAYTVPVGRSRREELPVACTERQRPASLAPL